MAWKYWEQYKQRVHGRRLKNRFYYELGVAVIRVVEECCMEEEVDAIIMDEIDSDPYEWDFNVEDRLGENEAFSHGVFVMYWGVNE